MQDTTLKLVLKIIVAILLPPAAAFWQVRFSLHFWVNLGLTLITWVAGIVHALWLILRVRYKALNADIKHSQQTVEPLEVSVQPTEASAEPSEEKAAE